METLSFVKSHVNERNVRDTLKVSLTKLDYGYTEVKFTKKSTSSTFPKEYKFYFENQDMLDLEETIKLYNETLNYE